MKGKLESMLGWKLRMFVTVNSVVTLANSWEMWVSTVETSGCSSGLLANIAD